MDEEKKGNAVVNWLGSMSADERYALMLFLAATALGLVGWFWVPRSNPIEHYGDQFVGGVIAGLMLAKLTERWL
ncbi:MAG: hypothetical protein ACYDHY_12955 [Acidiferrobacterales bacterium]